MRFAKWVFWIAGIWGFVVLAPLYFLREFIGTQDPPQVTHPEYFFGFVGVGLVWQFTFLLIASDPLRFRPIMIGAMLEKFVYVATVAILVAQHRASSKAGAGIVPDLLLGVLFVVAYFRTRALTPADRAVA